MTAPVVGAVSVEVLSDASKLAKSLRKEIESAFKGLDLGKAIRDSIGNTKITVPVSLDPDTDSIGEKVRRTRVPKVPVDLDPNTESIPDKVRKTRVPKVSVEVDPLLAAFQQEGRRQTAALARAANAKIPVGADTTGLRAELGAALAEVKAQTRIQVPTEPGAKAEYEAKLKAQLDEVAARVKQTVHVDVDVDTKGAAGGRDAANLLSSLTAGLKGFTSAGNPVSAVFGGLTTAAG